jgi:hypothetical protein
MMKRKRGGQLGNQNARKHGFYSSFLSQREICEFLNLTNREGLDREIALLRLRIKAVLAADPDNRRVLQEIAGLIATCYAVKYDLDRSDSNFLKRFLLNIFLSAAFSQNESNVIK